MKPIILKKDDVDKEPYIIWNTFVDIVACGDIIEMNEIQRKASLCFWYDSELQNGGHLQYFENMSVNGTTDFQEVVEALIWLGAKNQSEILLKAIATRRKEKRGFIKNVFDFVRRAEEGKYDILDNEYYECEPEVTLLLEEMLRKYQNEFITVEE